MADPANTSPSAPVEYWNGQFTKQAPMDYQAVAASQTAKVIGAVGAKGDYISHIVLVVATAAQSAVTINDGGGSEISIFPASPGAGIGTYIVPLGLQSRTGSWQLTTGSGVTAIVAGKFS